MGFAMIFALHSELYASRLVALARQGLRERSEGNKEALYSKPLRMRSREMFPACEDVHDDSQGRLTERLV